MEFTGERYVPLVEGQIKYEHLHRYAACLEFVAGKSVLDIASGEGYGAALLASAAESVTGVDVDLTSAEHARRTYLDPNLNFVVGSCESVPLLDASFDVVTSFETIEHHDKHEEMLREIKRLLKPEGVLIISTPNRLAYSDERSYTNPFHVKELYYDEFNDLLSRHFRRLRIYGQRLATGSFVVPLLDSGAYNLIPLMGNFKEVARQVRSLSSPMYFVAVCSDSVEAADGEISSVYLDPEDDLLKMFEPEGTAGIREMQDQVRSLEKQLIRERTAHERQLKQVRAHGQQLDETVAEMQTRMSAAEQAQIQAQSQISRHGAALEWIHRNYSWRMSESVRRIEQWRLRWDRFQKRIRRLPSRETFHGMLDYPKPGKPISDSIEIYGWVYSTAARVMLVQAFLDDIYLGIVRYGVSRPDVVEALPSEAPLDCGYKERMLLTGLNSGEKVLAIRVYDDKGNRQVYTRRITIDPSAALPFTVANSPGRTAAAEAVQGATTELERRVSCFTEFSRQIGEAVTEFQDRMERNPSMVDWNTGLNLAGSFPHLAVCSPPVRGADRFLPYLDCSIDIVVISSSDPQQVAEARRVAAAGLIRTRGRDLEVEWLAGAGNEPLLPMTSIVIPVYNNAGYTRDCLEQLVRTLPRHFRGEVIVVDDASTDETPALLEHWAATDDRIRVVRNAQNAGFISSCNRGAAAATGEILVFLNNDTLPQPGWLPPLLRLLRDRPEAGAAGGKLVYPDGTLQEAGCIVFSDGSACNFGKSDGRADASLYNFVREVDYCSGALLATRRELFAELGGFDTRFEPAYYEDSDYCFSLRARGYGVYYQPESVIVHVEGASSGTDINTGVKRYQAINRAKFVEKWGEALRHQPPAPDQYDLGTLHSLATYNTVKNGYRR